MAKSTVYPGKIKILGNKVYVRDLSSVTEEIDENENVIYDYKEELYSKDEYITMLKNENDNLKEAVDTLVLESLGL